MCYGLCAQCWEGIAAWFFGSDFMPDEGQVMMKGPSMLKFLLPSMMIFSTQDLQRE